MGEYIERKAAINKVSKIPAHFDSGDIRYGIEIAIQAIKDTPAVDVVEVVRCEDCKHYEHFTEYNKYFCNEYGGYVIANDFCSRAERKDISAGRTREIPRTVY